MGLAGLFVTLVTVGLFLGWLVVRFRSSDPDDRLVVLALQCILLSYVSRTDLDPSLLLAIRIGLFSMAGVLLALQVRRRGQVTLLGVWPLYGYCAVALAAGFVSPDPQVSLFAAVQFCAAVGVLSLCVAGLRVATVRRLALEFVAILAVSLVLQLLFVYGEATSPIRSNVLTIRITGWIHIGSSLFAAIVGAAMVLWAVAAAQVHRLVRLTLVVSGALLLVGSQRRAALLFVVVATIVFVGVRVNDRRFLFIVAALPIVVATALSVNVVGGFIDREAAVPEASNIASYRTAIFEQSFDRFRGSPVLGEGLGVGDRNLLIDLGEEAKAWSSHSELGTTVAATGAVGLVVLFAQYVWTASATWSSRRQDPIPLSIFAGLVAVSPFWAILSRPSTIHVVPFLFVFCAHQCWSVRLDRSDRWRLRLSLVAEAGS